MSETESNKLYKRARQVIPGGTQTISKRPENYVPSQWPAYWETAKGSHLVDIDGNKYLDYVLALGPILLGYNHEVVNAAVRRQLEKGVLTTLQSPLEVALAEKLVERVPCAEMVRFFKTGAESTAAAVRVARAVTGRDVVLSAGYAGCHDWCVAKSPAESNRRGVPELLRQLVVDVPLGDVDALERAALAHRGELACIIVEAKAEPHARPFLQKAKEMAARTGAIFILDEIVTGFRMGLSGAQGYFEVIPDLATFGKAMANGLPLAALVGRREIMKVAAELWLTSTYGGEALSLAASLAVVQELERSDAISHLWAMGERLLEGWKSLGLDESAVSIGGYGCCPSLSFRRQAGDYDGERDRQYVAAMLEQRVLVRPNHCLFVSAAHSEEDIDRTIAATAAALEAEPLVVK